PALQAFLERVGGPDAKDIVMTAGQRLIEQGIQQGVQQGIQQGVQQGIQQGVQQGERELLLELVRTRFGQQVDAGTEQRVATASREQIATWAKRVLFASTLAELFTD
ncbi:MAG: hypothetical protein H7138_12490, partial [Myxococcales bacterium]|nr:hypothetical protein [Myxococcales bacterium]